MAKRDKKVKQKESASNKKTPKTVVNTSEFWNKTPSWSFRLVDNNYTKWGLCHVEDVNSTIITKLKDYEGMTWTEIMQASGGRKSGTNNHYENVSNLIPEAQERWKALNLEEYDRVFSLRLMGTHRLYGILLNEVFKIIWFDPNHEIYPMAK